LTISVHIEGNPFPGMGARMRDLKPFFRGVDLSWWDNDSHYTRPDRMRGETTVEKHGRPINWIGKYTRRNRRLRATRKGIKLTCRVPFHPKLTPEAIDALTARLSRWLVSP